MIFAIFYRLKELIFKISFKWDRLNIDKDSAFEYAETYINKEPDRYLKNDNNIFSMEYCLAHSGESINERYREGRIDEVDREIAITLDNYNTDKDIIVYRGVCDYVFELMRANARPFKGIDLFEKGFMATSLVKGCEFNYKKKLRIFVPAGSKCVFMGNVNYESALYEVTLQHGAALKIVSIDKEYINCKLIKTA